MECKKDMQESTTIFKVDAFGGNPGALFLCVAVSVPVMQWSYNTGRDTKEAETR